MKITTRRDALFGQLQTVTRAASTRSAVQALSGVQVLATQGGIELRATDMEIGLRVPLEGDVVREGSVVLPARLVVDVVRALPGRRGDARAAPGRAGRRDRRRLGDVPHPHAALGGLPAVPGARGRARRRPRRRVRRDRAEGRALGLARRDASGPHRHPRLGVRRGAADGGDGLLPALGQGDAARVAALAARSRPTCRRARCRS